jgi:hypothetical protein
MQREKKQKYRNKKTHNPTLSLYLWVIVAHCFLMKKNKMRFGMVQKHMPRFRG